MTPSAALSWSIRPPPAQAPRGSEGRSGSWIDDLRSLRGFVLFDNGRRPYFQRGDTFFDEDPIDIHAHHVLAHRGEQLVGCVRVYCPTVDTPPCVTETLLGRHAFALLLEQLGLQRSGVVEIGRWTVDPNHRYSGWLAIRLAALSAALANALRHLPEAPRDIVLCPTGVRDRQDVILRRIGLAELSGLTPVYSDKYMDTVRVLSCSAIDGLSLRFRQVVAAMTLKLDIEGLLQQPRRHPDPRRTRAWWTAREWPSSVAMRET